MGRSLAFVILALAIGGAAFFLLTGDNLEDPGGGLDAGGEGITADDPAAGPGLKAGGTRRAPGPSGPARFSVTGRILNEGGEPVADVRVLARYTGKPWNRKDPGSFNPTAEELIRQAILQMTKPADEREPVVAEARTGADGTFDLPLAEPGKYRLAALPEAPLFGTQHHVSVHEEKLTEEITLRVLQGAPLHGRVLDSADGPVAATLTASWWKMGGSRPNVWNSEPVESAASDGAWRLGAVPNGTVNFTVLLPNGRRLTSVSVETPRTEPFVIRVPAFGGTVQGTVTDAAGAGVQGAVLVISALRTKKEGGEASGTTTAKAVTDAEGRYRIDDAPLGRVTGVQALAEKFLPYTESTALLAAEERRIEKGKPLTLDLTLSRGGTVQGRVTQQAGGSPIAGASVRLHAATNGPTMGIGSARVAVTDAGGRYRFDAVATGRYAILAEAQGYYLPQLKPLAGGNERMMYMPGRRQAPPDLTVVMTAEGTVVERDIALARGFGVSGRVLDAKQAGVSGAEVYARGYGLHMLGWQWSLGGMQKQALATSGAGGHFTVEGLPPKADWVLFATKKGYAGIYADPFPLDEESAAPDLTLKLEPGATLRGRVVDDAGKGIPDVQVNVWGQNQETAGGGTVATSDAEGAFELVGVPAGDWTLAAWAQGRGRKQTPIKGLTSGEVREGIELELASGVEVSGVVVDKDGEAISGLTLYLRPVGGGWSFNNANTDSNGRFTFPSAKEGRVQIFAFDGGKETPLGSALEAPASDLRLEHVRVKMHILRGEIRGPDGEPVPLASVSAIGGRRTGNGMSGPMPAIPMAPGGGTDAVNGAFELPVTGDGPWAVHASAPRDEQGRALNMKTGQADVADPSQRVVIQLERGRVVAGVVVDGAGKGLAGATVTTGRSSSEPTNERGAFRVTGLGDGRVTLRVRPPTGYVMPTFTMVDAGTTDVRIELTKGLRIAGKALDPEGKPLKQGFVSASWKGAGGTQPGNANAQLQPDGTFTLNGIPPGVSVSVQVQVWSATGGAALAPKSIENVRPGTLDLEIRMGSGLTIEGTVTGPDGKPVSGCYVYGSGVSNKQRSGYVQVGADGSWKLAGLEPGRYAIRVMRQDGGAQPAAVEVDAPATGVRITLPKSSKLSGRVEGLPEGGSRWIVRAVDADGAHLSAAIVAPDGSWNIAAVREGGSIWLHVSSPGQASYGRAGPVQPGREDVVVRIKAGKTITGTLDGLVGVESPRASVWAEGERGWRGSGVLNAATGTFTIEGLPPGAYTLKARTWNSSHEGEVRAVQAGAKDVRVTLNAR